MQNDPLFIAQLADGFNVIQKISALTYHYNARKLVYEEDKVKLYHYEPRHKKAIQVPLLVVFATVNRPEILDLFPDHSFVGGLLDQGMDVYLLDWGYPDKQDVGLSISDYVENYLRHCVEFIIQETKYKKINLLGICQGGLLCIFYSILFNTIKNLILISVPIDFSTRDNTVAKLLFKMNVKDLLSLTTNVPGAWLTQFFIHLRPFQLLGKKYLHFIDNLSDPVATQHFLQVEKWLHDAPDQTASSFAELVKEFYQENNLIKNNYHLNGKKIELSALKLPILNIMAREDEIVPMSASRVLKKYVGSGDYTQKIFTSGHIGIYVSDKVGTKMPKTIADWLKKRDK